METILSHIRILLIASVIVMVFNVYGATYTHSSAINQSATVSATIGSPDNYYDDGGSGGNYANNIAGTTYSFSPNTAGRYIRVAISSLALGAGDLIYIYNGSSTGDRLIGSVSSANNGNQFMWVSTEAGGSLTVQFVSDGATVDAGWSFEVYEGTTQGQEWLGTTNTSTNTASNWEKSIRPSTQTSVYIPNVANDPVMDASYNVFDFRLATGGSYTRSAGTLRCYGDFYTEGNYDVTGAYTVLNGGSSGNFAFVGGSGSYDRIALLIGFDQNAYYTQANDLLDVWTFEISSANSSEYDMNNFDLTVNGTSSGRLNIPAGQIFYQRSGTLSIASSAASIDNTSFVEGTGTTDFYRAGVQTLPAITYYNLTISGGGGNIKTLAGTTTVLNDLNIVTSSVLNTDAANHYKLIIHGNWVNNGTFTANNGEVEFTGAGVHTVSGASNTVFYDLRMDKGSDVTSSLELTVDTDVSNNTIFNNGLLIITHSGCLVNDQISADPDVATTSGVHINGGTYTTTDAWVYNMNGKFELSSGTANIGIASGNTFYGNSASVDIDITGGTLNCASRFRVTDGDINITGGTINTGIYGANTTISALFQVQANANLIFSGGTVNLIDENIHATGQDIRIMAGSTKDLTGGTFQIGTAATPASTVFDCFSEVVIDNIIINSTNNPTLNLIRNLEVNNLTINGTFDADATAATHYDLTVNEGFTNNGTFTARNGTVIFAGSAGQTISGTSETAFYDLTINNPSGVALGNNASAENIFTFSNGLFTIQGYSFRVGSTSSNGTINGESATRYFVAYDNTGTIGRLIHRINGNATYEYPVGTLTNYVPLTLTLNTNGGLTAAEIEVYTIDGKIPALGPQHSDYIDRQWSVEPTGITSPNYDINYVYVDGDIVGNESNILPVRLSNGTDWYRPSGSSFTEGTVQGTGSVTVGTNTLAWTGLTSFSLFSGVGDATAALPVTLTTFTAEKEASTVVVEWETASEQNNDYFLLERAGSDLIFEPIEKQEGAGNSSSTRNYTYFDRLSLAGVSYYRLKQVDIDGKFKYYGPISISNDNNNESLRVFPVPTSDLLQIAYNSATRSENGKILITDHLGKQISSIPIKISNGKNLFSVDCTSLKPGVYSIQLVNPNQGINLQHRFLKL